MIGIFIATITAFILSIILVNVDELINNKNKLEQQFEELLPGYNCGVCGFGNCAGMAKAMEEDVYNYKKCKPLRGEKLREMEQFIKMNNL